MPKIYESYGKTGNILPSLAKELGLAENVIVCAGAGDNAGAAVGTGTLGEGKCNISLGTSGTIFISSDKFSVDENNALHSFCNTDGGYHLRTGKSSSYNCTCRNWWTA